MVVPPMGGGSSSLPNNARASPAVAGTYNGVPKSKNGNVNGNGYHAPPNGNPTPISARKAAPLDMSTVERRGHTSTSREVMKRIRPHNLPEAPTYRPTEEEFKDPMKYIQSIAAEGRNYGIVKIIPPDGWNPDFAIDTQRFHFRTRRQELNSVEGGTRSNLNYLDQLAKFHKQHGTNLNRFPSVDKRPLDLYKLKKAVEVRGGFDKVCKLKKWAEIGRDLGYSGKIMSSLSTSLKNSYQRWLNPYEEYLRIAKPGVQQQLEFEYGGPLTPSPANSPMKKSQQPTPSSLRADSPSQKASQALHSSINGTPTPKHTPNIEAPRPISSSGFTAVNSGGFTAVNASPSSFTAVNATNGVKRESEPALTPSRSADSPLASAKNTPEYRPSGLGNAPITNGNGQQSLKRRLSHESMGISSNKENQDSTDSDSKERRSKRLKREAVPTVAGSYMTMFRPSTPKIPGESRSSKPGEKCEGCGKDDDKKSLLLCDSCDSTYHPYCLDPPIKANPEHDWHCPRCLVGTGEFGFEDGGVYSLKTFQVKAHHFKENHFMPKMPYDPVLNTKRAVTEDDVEREFWRLVENLTETVEVEYGADIHSTVHGSGFPTIEKSPLNPYSTDPWNLNILPLHSESLFRHIKSDISGMTVPWLYVGMCFSTFCWHNEDHYTYSANYQHFGATKTWYGIPGDDAEKFENAMREAVPELFETQPDLLFQLVTLLPPDQLRKAGVRVYALDQRAGQFVISFPQAYHAGFNHGFNFNEAVNFAPHDWEPWGEAGVERLQTFKRQPCFSHDELLLTAAARDTTIKTARWLGPALERLRDREVFQRKEWGSRHEAANGNICNFSSDWTDERTHRCKFEFVVDESETSDDDHQCSFCKTYCYLSRFYCKTSNKIMCLSHAGTYECCSDTEAERLTNSSHRLTYRVTEETLTNLVTKTADRARMPEAWAEKLEKAIEDEPKPSLKLLRSLLIEGEKILFDLPQLRSLKAFVERCNDWVEDATNYITRKQQNRRKNEKAWRKGNSAKAAELEERDRELRKIENVEKLLADADEISFDCPEITLLRERADAIANFRKDARLALENPRLRTTREFEELVEEGKGFNVDVPEVEELDKVVHQLKWNDIAREKRGLALTLEDVTDLIEQARELSIPEHNDHLDHLREQKIQGELWETKAKELMSVESVHYQQLEALANQAATLPVSRATFVAVDQILNKQREAHKQIVSLYERSKDPDFRRRPRYKDVRDVMETLVELNSKPTGTLDLEKEQKRHEDWMRKGKKLFGKANAPLHILLMHMTYVENHNRDCFNLKDRPRMPVEPSSREQSPEPSASENFDGIGRTREVFCICRAPEAGMMIECELCHEWYHGRCLKIARGKVKEDDKYTCPICDWRVKIPRDAARPKLEDLQDWQVEIPNLPFQPDEEECLGKIVDTAQAFRDFLRPYINPVMTTSEEVNTQRFYLRKIEGAEILLAWETNFFRQELHRWAPVAPEAPPVLEHSLSTRKPRPTKQQKIMANMGINDPEQLPQHYRTKSGSFSSKRKSSEPSTRHQPTPLQPALGQSASPTSPTQMTPGATRSTTAPTFATDGPPSFAFDNNYGVGSPQHVSPSFVENTFLPTSTGLGSPGFGQSPRTAGLDAALFTSPTFDRGDADAAAIGGLDANQYGSSQGAMDDSIFADLTNDEEPESEALANEHANDALAVSGDAADADTNKDGEETLFQD